MNQLLHLQIWNDRRELDMWSDPHAGGGTGSRARPRGSHGDINSVFPARLGLASMGGVDGRAFALTMPPRPNVLIQCWTCTDSYK